MNFSPFCKTEEWNSAIRAAGNSEIKPCNQPATIWIEWAVGDTRRSFCEKHFKIYSSIWSEICYRIVPESEVKMRISLE